MNWRQFEEYLGYLFRALGYKAEVTPPSGDFGVDVVATHPDGTRIAIQAKHWQLDYVGVEVVLKTVGGAAHYGCQKAIVVTTSGFSDAARQASRTTGVELWGPRELAEAIEQARARNGHAPAAASQQPIGLPVPRQAAAPTLPKPQPARTGPRPNCPDCGLPMTARTALERPIWLCSRFPACHGFRHRT